jgi:pyridoxal phosphate enzyme (YggS family)
VSEGHPQLDPELESSVARGLEAVRARIESAARAVGRDPADVALLAVSKLQPAAKLRAAYARGQRDFGENYAQELAAKARELSDLSDLRFHMIGHLQRNKVASLVGIVSAVHSVDSVRLAVELGKRAKDRPVPPARRLAPNGELVVFIEVNVAGEAQKSGCSPAELGDVIAAVRAEPALRLAGLMAVPAGSGELSAARSQFEMLRELQQQHGGPALLPGSSIGMSRDLEVAIACGSTYVRVGTDIFGARS